MRIAIICYAKTQEEAINAAFNICEQLTSGNYAPYDYFNIGAGKALGVESEEGKRLITECFENTKKHFMYNIGVIRGCLNKNTDEALFELWHDADMFKTRCRYAGENQGVTTYLYDNDGTGIRCSEHLQDVLSKWASSDKQPNLKEYKELGVWVVQVDVHP